MPQRDRINAADQSAFMSLFGLSATSVMRAQMLWDAENRLAAYIPLNQSGGAKKVTFKYDYRGRRVEKNVYAWNSGAGAWYGDAYPTERRRFVWNGWLMLRETIESDLNSDGDLDDQDEGTRVKTYTWGKDLGGGLESAGGIGGLLAVYDDSATSGSTGDDLAYVYMYDANGNVGQVCDLSQSTASASIVAKYEYDAYGNATVASGSYASANTYRFSTKPWDDETGLGYWGYRYYDPRLGRWMSRDPIDESGGINLYLASLNRPSIEHDALGLRCDDEEDEENEKEAKATGTCKKCDKICDKKESSVWGVTTCENNKVCYCVCLAHIRIGSAKGASSGIDRANEIIFDCTGDHEKVHVANRTCTDNGTLDEVLERKNEECEADKAGITCAAGRVGECGNEPAPKRRGSKDDERCKCLNRLKYFVTQKSLCAPDLDEHGNPDPSCPAKGERSRTKCLEEQKEATKKIAALKKEYGCK